MLVVILFAAVFGEGADTGDITPLEKLSGASQYVGGLPEDQLTTLTSEVGKNNFKGWKKVQGDTQNEKYLKELSKPLVRELVKTDNEGVPVAKKVETVLTALLGISKTLSESGIVLGKVLGEENQLVEQLARILKCLNTLVPHKWWNLRASSQYAAELEACKPHQPEAP
eukprot:GEMP01042404.1.p2 GENE.GEMP01042404.1~~GEMP01042404.1.p2  ORF type:complete len:169 (+),score=41.00 GEMP01042404.1:57-563(+)